MTKLEKMMPKLDREVSALNVLATEIEQRRSLASKNLGNGRIYSKLTDTFNKGIQDTMKQAAEGIARSGLAPCKIWLTENLTLLYIWHSSPHIKSKSSWVDENQTKELLFEQIKTIEFTLHPTVRDRARQEALDITTRGEKWKPIPAETDEERKAIEAAERQAHVEEEARRQAAAQKAREEAQKQREAEEKIRKEKERAEQEEKDRREVKRKEAEKREAVQRARRQAEMEREAIERTLRARRQAEMERETIQRVQQMYQQAEIKREAARRQAETTREQANTSAAPPTEAPRAAAPPSRQQFVGGKTGERY